MKGETKYKICSECGIYEKDLEECGEYKESLDGKRVIKKVYLCSKCLEKYDK